MAPLAEQEGLLVVRPLVDVVPQFVVHDIEILAVDLDAHFDADVVLGVDVPGASVTDRVVVLRLVELRALPERLGERIEPSEAKNRSP